MIAAPWIVSAAISSPIALGLNRTARRADTPRLCTFYNSDFLIYSSMGSFYVPTVVMIVLYWRVYLAIRSRRAVSTLSARSQQTRTGNEAVSCTATAPPPLLPPVEVRRDDAGRGVTGAGPASNSDATLSAVAASLSAVHRRRKELAGRVATAVDRTTTVEQWDGGGGLPGKFLPPDYNQCIPPRSAPIAVIETDDLATLSPPSTLDGSVDETVLPNTAQLTPISLYTVAVDTDSVARDTAPSVAESSAPAQKNVASTATQKLGDTEQDASDCAAPRRLATLSVPPAALNVSTLCSRRPLVDAGGAEAASTRCNSDDDDGPTVMRVETASAAAPVADRVNGRFVTFFNFTSKQRPSASSAAYRRQKRAVRRERRATKTLAIVLGNFVPTTLIYIIMCIQDTQKLKITQNKRVRPQ